MKRLLLLAALILLAKLLLRAEDTAPSAPVVRPAKQSRFLRPRNVLLFTLDASAIAADGFTTQRAFGLGWREVNPLAQPFGKSRTATITLCSAGMALTIWGSHEAHRRRWHRLEWVIPLAVVGAETAVAIHNARLMERWPRAGSQRPARGVLIGFPLGSH